MAVYESGYPSLIQGASQQVPDKRLDGQVSNQLNMVSDALTGLRRRKGFELLRFLPCTASGCSRQRLSR
uniref:phage nozzle protein n=1 Tax=Serratia quinivorans TaxID=137545 RepID=UPI004048697E